MASPGWGRPMRLDDLRQWQENERQWRARREFLSRYMHLYPGPKMDQLIGLSMVWSNIVFMGNRYGEQVTKKVQQMGEGINVGEMPSFELVPGAKKRPGSPNADGQPTTSKKNFGPRPRFQPLHFVSSTVEDDKVFLKTNLNQDNQTPHKHFTTPDTQPQPSELCFPSTSYMEADEDNQTPYKRFKTPDMQPQASELCFLSTGYMEADEDNQPQPSELCFPPTGSMEDDNYSDPEQDSSPYICDPNATDDKKNDFGQFMKETEQSYAAKFESHYSSLGKDFRSKVLDSWQDLNQQGRKGIGFVKPPKQSGKNRQNSLIASTGLQGDSQFKLASIKKLSSIVQKNMNKALAEMKRVNLTSLLSRSVQTCKMNPEYIYETVKNPPRQCTGRRQGGRGAIACEVRCMNVYLAMGYSFSKQKARDQAIDLAIRLLLEPSLDVASVRRKCGKGYRNDMVAYSADAGLKEPPPFIKPGVMPTNEYDPSEHDGGAKGTAPRPLSDFVIVDGAADAIGKLKASSDNCRMAVEYKYEMMPNSMWRCCVYVEGHYISEAFGNKKHSKHAAAEAAVKILRTSQSVKPRASFNTATVSAPSRQTNDSVVYNPAGGPSPVLNEFVIYEHACDAISTLCSSAQFNKVERDFVLEHVSGQYWRCKVFLDQKFIAEAVDVKKTVKQKAAEAALNILKKTNPVVVNSAKTPAEASISRQQIKGSTGAPKQPIQEDNVGNRLLRKMGWTGGGLGKEGEGIAEPINVQEQVRREGLGMKATNQMLTWKDVENIIHNYLASSSEKELTFSKELTNEERKIIHAVANRYQLKSKSYGKGQNRYLVISRKMNREDLLLRLKEQGQFGSYAMVLPQN